MSGYWWSLKGIHLGKRGSVIKGLRTLIPNCPWACLNRLTPSGISQPDESDTFAWKPKSAPRMPALLTLSLHSDLQCAAGIHYTLFRFWERTGVVHVIIIKGREHFCLHFVVSWLSVAQSYQVSPLKTVKGWILNGGAVSSTSVDNKGNTHQTPFVGAFFTWVPRGRPVVFMELCRNAFVEIPLMTRRSLQT